LSSAIKSRLWIARSSRAESAPCRNRPSAPWRPACAQRWASRRRRNPFVAREGEVAVAEAIHSLSESIHCAAEKIISVAKKIHCVADRINSAAENIVSVVEKIDSVLGKMYSASDSIFFVGELSHSVKETIVSAAE
jgi:hypothetical protein